MDNKPIYINTKLGHKIALTVFKRDNPKGIVVISSATGVKQKYYYDFAVFLQTNGFIVCTFDYNGIGLSNTKNIKTIKTNASDWGKNDLDAVLNYALEKHSHLRTTLIGHSIGGQLIGFAPLAIKIDTIIMVASQSGYWKLWNGFEKNKMFLFWYLVLPLFTKMFGYFPSKKLGIMENLPKNMALEWGNWCKKQNYLFDEIDENTLHYHKIKANLSSYSTDFDEFAPKKAVDWITKKYKNATVKRIHLNPKTLNIPKIGHFGFFKKKFEKTIWQLFLNDINNGSVSE